ncbi:MAG: hypothetical protein RR268_05295 [Kiritimatiellia bacterium]
MRFFLISFALFLHMIASAQLSIRPYENNGWATGKNLPELTLTLTSEERVGVQELFSRIDAWRVKVARRAHAYTDWLALIGVDEMMPSNAAVRFELCWFGQAYAFDRWGAFHIDERFITSEDVELLTQFETFYRTRFATTVFAKDSKTALQVRPIATAESLPIFCGFEDDRYQQYDALILKLTAEFNANHALSVGSTQEKAIVIPELDPALIKSLMIEESGGNGPRSREAWEVDPIQVNVPGDWTDAKLDLGLQKPTMRNEGTPMENIRAGIKYLARKGFGISGQSIANRPEAYFDSWRTALQRYNGRKDLLHDGRSYRSAYATRILRRAANPTIFVPIASDVHPNPPTSSMID